MGDGIAWDRRAEPGTGARGDGAAEAPRIVVPEQCLVLLVGIAGSGKSSFAARHFAETEVVSSDRCRALISDDETDQRATADAFALLRTIVAARLARGRLTVVDATNLDPESRAPLLALAREAHVQAVAIVLDPPLRRGLGGLAAEGFAAVWTLRSAREAAAAVVTRRPLAPDRRGDTGPFDIVGDVHGCADELLALLTRLGYEVAPDRRSARPPAGRKAIFLGDLVDRGPDGIAVLRLVMGMVAAGQALCVAGNHDATLLRALRDGELADSRSLAVTLERLAAEPAAFAAEVGRFLDGLPAHLVLDGGRLVVAHAGLPEALQGRVSAGVTAFALQGEAADEVVDRTQPAPRRWAQRYRGDAMVVYGHVPVAEPRWLHRTIGIDTGCVYGGRLTALRYPESALVSVPAAREYHPPRLPLAPPLPPS
jgi:diadenosine tetraphosphatase ApaH/serine/threonine PP2A family protein phosphatase